MRGVILAALAALSLAACATTATTVTQTAEKIDTDASAAYVAIATGANAYIAANPAASASAQALELKAWGLYAQEHAVYKSGAVGDITTLLAIAQCVQAKGVAACL